MTINRDWDLLHPKMRGPTDRLYKYLIDAYETRRTKTRFEFFEGFRDPRRQADLIAKRVSKAGPYQSAHQFGLAADLAPFITPDEAEALTRLTGERHVSGWNWHSSHDYSFLAASAKKFNLSTPIAWDPCHVQHPNWEKLREAFRKYVE